MAANTLDSKTAIIDPPELADEKVLKRVVDYAIVFQPNPMMSQAWRKLQPMKKTGIKSWNHIPSSNVRSIPIAVNVEIKVPNKSWTDGKAQLGIWITALHKRMSHLQKPGQCRLKILAMPLLIAQGHDWHMLIISQQTISSNQLMSTVVWEKIAIGNTRNCFDAFKLISVLHLLMDWAQTVWRPWFLELVE